MTADLDTIGAFDVTFFLGVLYHLQEPFEALKRLYAVTGELAVIETLVMILVARADTALWQFFPSDEMLGDPGNWWAPNLCALHALCTAAGFSRVETIVGPPVPNAPGPDPIRYRAVVHAFT